MKFWMSWYEAIFHLSSEYRRQGTQGRERGDWYIPVHNYYRNGLNTASRAIRCCSRARRSGRPFELAEGAATSSSSSLCGGALIFLSPSPIACACDSRGTTVLYVCRGQEPQSRRKIINPGHYEPYRPKSGGSPLEILFWYTS